VGIIFIRGLPYPNIALLSFNKFEHVSSCLGMVYRYFHAGNTIPLLFFEFEIILTLIQGGLW